VVLKRGKMQAWRLFLKVGEYLVSLMLNWQ
jgi:hypothetical protein